jgi:ATP-dependent RNA helicase RhlE
MTTVSDFASLGLSEQLVRAVAARNYTTPTPIQARSIPHLLQARDLLGIAQTGTGKTAAFALPMLQLLHGKNRRPRPKFPRALVLAPTRALAPQLADAYVDYGKHFHLRVAIVFGGVGQNPQVQALLRGIDILVATPGRLLDLIQQRHCDLSQVEILVLDEADRMLDMGFLPDVRRILQTLPKDRQSLLFSATMPADITALAAKFLRDPVRVEVTPPAATADRIEQSVWFVQKPKKRDLLIQLLSDPQFERVLVFTRTKHGADRVVKDLRKANIEAHAIHGNKSQNAREKALDQFRDGKANVLVATDIAARGIDVPEISHVVNYDLPNIPESYVHRIGRTARAGRDGIAISFCDDEEREYLRDIEKLIKKRIPVAGNQTKEAAQQRAAARVAQEAARLPAAVPSSSPWDATGFGDGIDGDGDGDEQPAREPARPPQRQRPEPRQRPGPYVPAPARHQHGQRPHSQPTPPQQPRHERQRHGQGRPAMPNAVDPEQRRGTPHQPHPAPPPHRRAQGGGHGRPSGGHGNQGGSGGHGGGHYGHGGSNNGGRPRRRR